MPNAIKCYLIDNKKIMKTNETCKIVWIKTMDMFTDKSIKFYHNEVHCQDCNFADLDTTQISYTSNF